MYDEARAQRVDLIDWEVRTYESSTCQSEGVRLITVGPTTRGISSQILSTGPKQNDGEALTTG